MFCWIPQHVVGKLLAVVAWLTRSLQLLTPSYLFTGQTKQTISPSPPRSAQIKDEQYPLVNRPSALLKMAIDIVLMYPLIAWWIFPQFNVFTRGIQILPEGIGPKNRCPSCWSSCGPKRAPMAISADGARPSSAMEKRGSTRGRGAVESRRFSNLGS